MWSALRASLAPARAAAPLCIAGKSLSKPSLFAPTSTFLARSMKVMSAIKKRCSDCMIVRRGNISYVYCKTHPRHKARQGPKRRLGKPQAPPAASSAVDILRGTRGAAPRC